MKSQKFYSRVGARKEEGEGIQSERVEKCSPLRDSNITNLGQMSNLDQNKKARKLSLAGFRILVPRPGLEPGTCGLTEIQARQKPNKIKDL